MKKQTQLKCRICNSPATGTPDYWRCITSKYHYWRWRMDKMRKAKRSYDRHLTPYQRQVLSTFKSDHDRAQFLDQHRPTYPVGA